RICFGEWVRAFVKNGRSAATGRHSTAERKARGIVADAEAGERKPVGREVISGRRGFVMAPRCPKRPARAHKQSASDLGRIISVRRSLATFQGRRLRRGPPWRPGSPAVLDR